MTVEETRPLRSLRHRVVFGLLAVGALLVAGCGGGDPTGAGSAATADRAEALDDAVLAVAVLVVGLVLGLLAGLAAREQLALALAGPAAVRHAALVAAAAAADD